MIRTMICSDGGSIQAMTEERNQLAELFAACWKDEALEGNAS